MFYSQFILAKKGPLGTIWIAAHLERKLRKNQITETNISASVDSILFPEVPIALRLSGHLLLGVVRIYSRKVNYLFHDCSEALVKIKHAFHSTSVDLPPEASTASFRSITLPDTFDFDELEVYLKRDNDLRAAVSRGIVDHNVSARDLITLREKTDDQADPPLEFAQDEGFPELGDPYSVLVYSEEELLHEGVRVSTGNVSATQEKGGPILEEDVLPPLQMDDEMDLGRTNIDEDESTPSGQKIEVAEQDGIPLMQIDLDTRLGYSGVEALQESLIPSSATEQPVILASNASISIDEHTAPMSLPMPDIRSEVPDVEKLRSAVESKEPEPLFVEFEEDMGLNKDALEVLGHKTSIADYDMEINDAEATPILKETPILTRPSPVTVETFGDFHDSDDLLATILGGRTPALKMMGSPSETPAFTQQKRGRSKRKAVFDDVVILSSILMKKQLANTDELRRKRRKIPLTEFELWKLQGSYNEQKFARPSLPGLCADVRLLYTRVIKLPAMKPLVKSPLDKETVNVETCEGSTHDTRILDLDAMETAEDMSTQLILDRPLISTLEPSEGVTALHTLVNVQNAQSPDSSPVNNEKGQESIEPVVATPEPAAAEGDPCGKVVKHSEDSKVTIKTGFHEAALSEGLLPDAASDQAPENLVFLADPQDRVFLASDEEEVLEEADVNHNRKGKPFQDKNGWSLRTKAVAQYLKSTLEKMQSCEGETCHASKLSLDNLLRGRTRKEAARMYFETLVLKSKDYIHVEQDVGFANIMLSATELLRKEVF